MSEVDPQAGTTAPQYFVTPGYGEGLLDKLRYRQAVRMGDVVQISGQGGWDDEFSFPDDLAEETSRAFDNVERTLALTGAAWHDVVSVESFHVPTATDEIGDEHTQAMVTQFRRRMGDHAPIWTQVGVAALGAPGMRVEVKVTAVIDGRRGAPEGPRP